MAGAAIGVVSIVVLLSRAHLGLVKARSLAELQHWSAARRQLDRYLWLYPSSDEAHLLAAEALVKDETLPADPTVQQALDHLGKISDKSPLAAEARTQEGRLCLLLLNRPARAERALRKAIELAPDSYEAHYLLWKDLDLSGRSHLAESVFWDVYRLSLADQRPQRLRDWYMSQFYPTTADPTLDRLLGFIPAGESSDNLTEFRRLLEYRNSERDDPLGHASVARWFLQSGDAHQALKLLDEASGTLENELESAWFVAALVSAQYELGKFAEAQNSFENWPGPKSGHEYWRWEAIVHDEILEDSATAVVAYDRALAAWPGHVDWRLRFRKANCLARLGRGQEAKQEREQAQAIERLLRDDVHRRIRAALGELERAENLQELADFYGRLQRPREEACWSDEARRARADQRPADRQESSTTTLNEQED